eukprot:CAMPEP_0119015838 /NCGR_PEP_ID=MMETSP1176-20130426/11681_1 /TAXON_ID=265551 /ORGANISM="Synedropsis recta cf, Strain CCMP1620" /LENGTH=151 /DNA_ID=CAMNT_0006969161 /DNA_START=25 /DNA_END=477 /DNA_ORIENTATION=+
MTMTRRLHSLLLLVLPFLSHASFILNVNHDDEDCFVVRTPKGPQESIVTGSFDLLDDKLSPDPVSLVILNDKLEHLYRSAPSVKSGSFSVIASGRLSLCVRNGIDNNSNNKKKNNKFDKNQRMVGLNVQVKNVDHSSSLRSGIQGVQSKLW